jgi:hypothetical protein
MIDCGILIDSTVFCGGKRKSNTHSYDFTNYPVKDKWNFNEDPSIESEGGNFREMSISSMQLDSYSYCILIGMKIINKLKAKHNGKGISPPINEIAGNLFKKSNMPVSIDAVKSEFLMREFKRREKKGDPYLSIISHPKSMDDKSMKTLLNLIRYAVDNGHTFSTVGEN